VRNKYILILFFLFTQIFSTKPENIFNKIKNNLDKSVFSLASVLFIAWFIKYEIQNQKKLKELEQKLEQKEFANFQNTVFPLINKKDKEIKKIFNSYVCNENNKQIKVKNHFVKYKDINNLNDQLRYKYMFEIIHSFFKKYDKYKKDTAKNPIEDIFSENQDLLNIYIKYIYDDFHMIFFKLITTDVYNYSISIESPLGKALSNVGFEKNAENNITFPKWFNNN
jgi:hypothetical protein